MGVERHTEPGQTAKRDDSLVRSAEAESLPGATALAEAEAVLDRAPARYRTAHALRQDAVVQLQATVGNRYVAQMLVQRQGVDAAPHPGSLTVQRRCQCGGEAGPDGECAACREKRLAAERGALPDLAMQKRSDTLALQRQAPPAPDPGKDERCRDLLGLIREAVAILIQRAADLLNDPLGLQWDNWNQPKIMPDGRNLGSVAGHQQQFGNWQQRLRNLLDQWNNDDCNSTGRRITQEERDWAWREIPAPIPRPRPNTEPQPWNAPGTEPSPTARRVGAAAKGAAIGTAAGMVLGGIVGAVLGGGGGTLVAPGVGTVGGGVAGAAAGAEGGAVVGAPIGAALGGLYGWLTGE